MSNSHIGPGLWEKTAAPAPATSALSGTLRADVAIVGAGFTGLSAALHLAQAGVKTAVVEAAGIGFGGSGRNVGLVNAGLWLAPDDVLRVLGDDRGRALIDMLGAAPDLVYGLVARHEIECEAHRTGTLHCAVGKGGRDEIERRYAQWRRLSAPVELLDAAAAAALTGSPRYQGALLNRRAGTIQPLSYARGLARAALAAGAQIFTQSAVRSAGQANQQWHLTTPTGKICADWVIVATNAYSTGLWPGLRSELVLLPYFQFATRPLPMAALERVLPQRQGAWDTRRALSSFRLDRHGRLVVGSVGALRHGGSVIHEDWARRAVRYLFPFIEHVEFESAWHGQIAMTDDSVPRFHCFAPNAIGVCGYNGRGIGAGTAFGRALADAILGKAGMPLTASPVKRARLRIPRELTYEYGAQALHAIQYRK